jgi:hypothetical protein
LLVKPSGARLWRFKYSFAGREKLLAFGDYRDVSLKRAREKRDHARRLVADGVDPSAERKAERIAHASTFRAIAEEWIALQAKALVEGTVDILRGRLTTMLYPALGNRPMAAIKAPELLAVLRRIESRGTHETAHRVRARFSRIARYAIATGRAERDISGDLRGALAPRRQTELRRDHGAAPHGRSCAQPAALHRQRRITVSKFACALVADQ